MKIAEKMAFLTLSVWFFSPVALTLLAQTSPDIAYIDIDKKWNVINASEWVGAPAGSANSYLGGITFNVIYMDVVNGTGVGFDAGAGVGTTRQATVNAVLAYIDSILVESGTVDIVFANSQTDGTGFLASAGTLHFTGPAGFSSGFAFTHITTGVDPCDAACGGGTNPPDINATVDFGYPWNDDTGPPTGSEFDLFSLLLHEITHGLGISSLVEMTGNSAISGGNPGVFNTFDELLETGNGTDLFTAGGTFAGSTTDLTGMDGGVVFTGTNATTNFGSNPPIFAPGVFQDGSSIAHWDSAISGMPVMVPALTIGTQVRNYSSYEIQTLRDLGYGNAVPVTLQSISVE